MIRSRAGFTLVELLIVLVMLGLVGGITVRVLTDTQRITVAQGERAMMQSTARTGALVVPSELREVNPALGDIMAMDDTSITYRGMRTLAVSCDLPTAAVVRVATASIQGLRGFVAGDSVMVFAEGDALDGIPFADEADTRDDDGWAPGVITGVSTATACGNGAPGTTLLIAGGLLPNGNPASFRQAAVVRGYEETTLAAYTDGNGDDMLGMITKDQSIQPVLGPLAADSGLRLVYRDGSGNITTTTTAVRSIDVTVRSITSRPVHKGQGYPAVEYDSLRTRIALRNAF